MTSISRSLISCLLIVAACDSSGSTSSTSSTSSTGDSATGDEADRRPPPPPAPPVGLPCEFDDDGLHDCDMGLQCVPHPDSGELFCVAPCVSPGVCPGPALDENGDPVPGVCLPDSDGVSSCFAE